jgi:PAS domain S-box-containing protein
MIEGQRLKSTGRALFSTLARIVVLELLACGLSLALASPPIPNKIPGAPKNILVLYSFSEHSAFDSVELLEAAIRSRVAVPVNFYVEYLETQRLIDPNYERSQAEILSRVYGNRRLDLVIVAAFPAMQFALTHRNELFPGTPIVFSYVHPGRIAGKSWPGVTGVTVNAEPCQTIDVALRFHPHASTIAIVSNTSAFEQYWLGKVHEELAHYGGRLKVVDLIGLPGNELLKQVAALPSQTIVLFQIAPQVSIQSAIGPDELVAAIGKQLPTYCIFSSVCLNYGGVGGSSLNDDQTELTANTASQVLAGERPENIPVVQARRSRVRLDWRELQRWHIPESAIPPDSVVLYRKPSFWERDRRYIIVAILLIVTQSILIAGLLLQRARKRRAEAVLRESEERFRVMANSTPALIWMADGEGQVAYINDRRLVFTGGDTNAGYGESWTTYVHPDDLAEALAGYDRALQTRTTFSREYRLRRNDGVYRWMFDVASPRFNGDGSFAGFIGSAIDITDQRLAQEALENVSGRLIEAQEKERTRIARDLHDDICQRLALLSMELDQANREGAPPATHRRLEEIRQRCAEITSDVQALSHQLHSSKLDYLGIVAAARGFCREFAVQHKADIEFAEHDIPQDLPKEASLCLFRILQEALHNAAKYSGTRQYSVTLTGTETEVRLTVQDRGVGFDVELAREDRGLGLVSMQERANLVHAGFKIESKPGAGTTVTVAVPLPAKPIPLPAEAPMNAAAVAGGKR